MDNAMLINWCDDNLVEIEAQAKAVDYDIDSDINYQQICEQLTEVSFDIEDEDIDAIFWVSIAYSIGVIRGRIAEKEEIG